MNYIIYLFYFKILTYNNNANNANNNASMLDIVLYSCVYCESKWSAICCCFCVFTFFLYSVITYWWLGRLFPDPLGSRNPEDSWQWTTECVGFIMCSWNPYVMLCELISHASNHIVFLIQSWFTPAQVKGGIEEKRAEESQRMPPFSDLWRVWRGLVAKQPKNHPLSLLAPFLLHWGVWYYTQLLFTRRWNPRSTLRRDRNQSVLILRQAHSTKTYSHSISHSCCIG